jgi:hypothetical protein
MTHEATFDNSIIFAAAGARGAASLVCATCGKISRHGHSDFYSKRAERIWKT